MAERRWQAWLVKNYRVRLMLHHPTYLEQKYCHNPKQVEGRERIRTEPQPRVLVQS